MNNSALLIFLREVSTLTNGIFLDNDLRLGLLHRISSSYLLSCLIIVK